MELLENLGIQPLSFAAQLVNFLILFGILWKFAYKPLLRVMRERRERIEKSLADAKKIEEDLQTSRARAQQLVTAANERAQSVVQSVERESEKIRQDKLKAAEVEATQVYKRAETGIKEERVRIKRELEAQTFDLVTQATERVLSKGIDVKTQQRLIKDAIEELS